MLRYPQPLHSQCGLVGRSTVASERLLSRLRAATPTFAPIATHDATISAHTTVPIAGPVLHASLRDPRRRRIVSARVSTRRCSCAGCPGGASIGTIVL